MTYKIITVNKIFCTCQILKRNWEYSKALHQKFTDFKKAYDLQERSIVYHSYCKWHSTEQVTLHETCLNKIYSIGHRLNICQIHFLFKMAWKNKILYCHCFLTVLATDYTIECAISKVQINHDTMEMNGTHQLLSNVDVVNLLDKNTNTKKKITNSIRH